MVDLLEGLQALARGEAAGAAGGRRSSSADVLDAAVTARASRHPAPASSWPATSRRGVVDGWEGGLRLIVDNLLDNAALHGRGEGGSVASASSAPTAELVIRVEDDGAGIPADERERLLEPFAAAATRDRRAPASGSPSSPSRLPSTAADPTRRRARRRPGGRGPAPDERERRD